MNHPSRNPWKGFVLGALGATTGVIAMRYYWKVAAAVTGSDPRSQDNNPDIDAFGSISLIGKHHEQGESSTAAMGRNAYRLITGHDPESEETKTTLSYLVHWGYSMLMGGVYGAIRGNAGWPDIPGALALGTASSPPLHAHAFGAHRAYSLATSATTQVLHHIT